MEEAAYVDKLILFGLSRQEATLYLCLLKNSEMTGYEIAKLTGISRSNVYNGLAGLVEQGAAYVLEGTTNKYTAVSLEEFCDNQIRYLCRVKTELIENMPVKKTESEGYVTVSGYEHICDKIHHMIISAEQRIYFSASGAFLKMWHDEISALVGKNIKVVLISEDSSDIYENDNEIRRNIIFYQVPKDVGESSFTDRQHQIRLIIDSQYVLTGEVQGKKGDTCLYSAQKNFVNVFKDAMRNEIELIKIKRKDA